MKSVAVIEEPVAAAAVVVQDPEGKGWSFPLFDSCQSDT